MENSYPIPIGPARLPSGKFASPQEMAAIKPVILANGVIGFQVGPGGRIYSKHDHAVKYAERRLAYFGKK